MSAADLHVIHLSLVIYGAMNIYRKAHVVPGKYEYGRYIAKDIYSIFRNRGYTVAVGFVFLPYYRPSRSRVFGPDSLLYLIQRDLTVVGVLNKT